MRKLKHGLKASVGMFLAICMSIGMLSGCAGNSSSQASSQSGSSTATTEKTTIQLWHYFSTEGSQQKFLSYVNEFNAQSKTTEVKVTVLPFADFKTKLTVSASANSLPDLAMIDNCDTVSYAAMGILEDVSSQVSDWESVKKYYKDIMATCEYKDGIYGLPLESNNLEIIYNKDIFDKSGVKYPDSTWTFDDLRTVAKKLTNSSHYGFAVSGVKSEESTYQFLPFFWTAGGETMKLNSSAGKTALGLWTNLISDGSMPRDCINWTQSELASQFKSGNIAIHVMGCWNLSNYKKAGLNYGVVEIPAATTGGKQVTVYGGENLCVIKGKNTTNALEFLKWFEDYDRISQWTYYIDHFTASQDTLTDSRYTTDAWSPFIKMIPNTKARDVVSYWPSVSTGYQTAIQQALSGQVSVSEALVNGQAEIDKALSAASSK